MSLRGWGGRSRGGAGGCIFRSGEEVGDLVAKLDPLKIIVRGRHDMGKTTVANLIKMYLEENGFRYVSLRDVEPLPVGEKDEFMNRFMRNRERPVQITVELEE